MIAVDTNILLAADPVDHPFHARAKSAVRKLAEGGASWAIPIQVLIEFYGKATHPKIWKTRSTPQQAWGQIDAWLASPTLRLLGEDVGMLSKLRALCEVENIRGSKVHDARIASACLQHRVGELWTFDRDFSRFSELLTRNPL